MNVYRTVARRRRRRGRARGGAVHGVQTPPRRGAGHAGRARRHARAGGRHAAEDRPPQPPAALLPPHEVRRIAAHRSLNSRAAAPSVF